MYYGKALRALRIMSVDASDENTKHSRSLRRHEARRLLVYIFFVSTYKRAAKRLSEFKIYSCKSGRPSYRCANTRSLSADLFKKDEMPCRAIYLQVWDARQANLRIRVRWKLLEYPQKPKA
jgi:hypothetical protein